MTKQQAHAAGLKLPKKYFSSKVAKELFPPQQDISMQCGESTITESISFPRTITTIDIGPSDYPTITRLAPLTH